MTGITPRQSVPVLIAAAASALAATAGCTDSGPEQYQVSGTVTYEGQPVPAGAIYFEPVAADRIAPSGYGLIRDGTFRTQPGRGAPPGRCTVRIRGGDGKPRRTPAQELDGPDPEGRLSPKVEIGTPLFADYTTVVELPAADSTLELTVPVAGR